MKEWRGKYHFHSTAIGEGTALVRGVEVLLQFSDAEGNVWMAWPSTDGISEASYGATVKEALDRVDEALLKREIAQREQKSDGAPF